ncbi:MAG: Eco57I restriction-modification methylase domain-containing protein [Microcoleaceae cyanobacterium]
MTKNANILNNRQAREILRNKGQFWTPAWVAIAMVAYVANNSDLAVDLICDPATGRGAFWQAMRSLNLSQKFWGFDIDQAVLEDEIYQAENCWVTQQDFLHYSPDHLFPAIVANPPYIRHHRLDQATKQYLKQLCQTITGFTIDGRAGYHVYFLLQALNLLAPDGKLAIIMPADVCEGVFANKLWRWITQHFCVEYVITFAREATVFLQVDTNPIIFCLKRCQPQPNFFWLQVQKSETANLLKFMQVMSTASANSEINSINQQLPDLKMIKRDLAEGLQTGFSRSPQILTKEKIYHLQDFAKIMRGIATGANEFFFLTHAQVQSLKIPRQYFKLAIGRTKDITGDRITVKDLENLEKKQRPTLLLSIDTIDYLHEKLHPQLIKYLSQGEKLGLPERALIRQRKPWYKMEKRQIPPILFTYLGRRHQRFIKNEAVVLPLTGFLCIYPHYSDPQFIDQLWQALNEPATINNLSLVGKSYGAGAIKVEPGNLERLVIPENIVKKYSLDL